MLQNFTLGTSNKEELAFQIIGAERKQLANGRNAELTKYYDSLESVIW
jgi:hypothetical protein